jgi:pyrroloquinoline quinone (PQQ) biosynthesis protein C
MERKEFTPSFPEGAELERFRAKIKELQEGTPDNYLREITAADLGDAEREAFAQLNAGTLTGEEVIEWQDAAATESQKLFYRYLGARLSDQVFDKRLEKEQS